MKLGLFEYAEMVQAMRDAQKDYFRDRTRSALARAKDWEQRVDKATLTLVVEKPQQGTLGLLG